MFSNVCNCYVTHRNPNSSLNAVADHAAEKIRKFPDPWNNFASEKMPDCSSSDYKKKKQLTYLMKKLPLNHLQNPSQLQGRILKKKKRRREEVGTLADENSKYEF
jgi:hypothetical protein